MATGEAYGKWKLKRSPQTEQDFESFTPRIEDDGAAVVSEGGAYGTYVDLEGTARTEAELVTRYRSMAQQPECDLAVSDIVDEAIVDNPDETIVKLNLDKMPNGKLKRRVREAFDEVYLLLDFKNKAYEIFNDWYVDGRLYYHAIVDEANMTRGIQEMRSIDPRKIRKVRSIKKTPVRQGTNVTELSETKEEYYVFNDRGFAPQKGQGFASQDVTGSNTNGLKIHKDAIVLATSGLLDEGNKMVLSHLHKAIKPLNQLRVLEDASVIYRLARAPERRVFYIDVGSLPKMKAEQHLRDMMVKHKNRLVYDASTGAVRDDRKFMTMLEDFWLPRREGSRGTEITTLPGGQNLGEMDDVLYFQKRLYRSLNVPVSRLEPDQGFAIGRASEISRDEVKYQKFIRRLQLRFTMLFDRTLEKQLILKNDIKPEDWHEIRSQISYIFLTDNHFAELKEMEILKERFDMLGAIEPYIGRFVSEEWVRKRILRFDDEEIKAMDKQINAEPDPEPRGDDGIPLKDNDFVTKPGDSPGGDKDTDVKASANTTSSGAATLPKPNPKKEGLYDDDVFTPDLIIEDTDDPSDLDVALTNYLRDKTGEDMRDGPTK